MEPIASTSSSRTRSSARSRFGSFPRIVSALAALAAVALPARAWEGPGHQYVARLAVASMGRSAFQQMLARNADWLAVASSHPDRWRNRPDQAEGPRHFLDTERFGVGTDLSKIPHDFSDLLKSRTYEQLRQDGVNPWTVRRVYQLLVIALREKRWDDAMVQAAYLSHYVGDAHVPFHASENYDGQLSTPPQRGIHRRFEGQTLERTIRFDQLTPGKPDRIERPVDDMFRILQESIDEVPAILNADRKAATIAGNTTDDAYWSVFSAVSRPIAVRRLEAGGRRLAGFYEAAWRAAGRPRVDASFTMTDRLLPYAPEFVPRGTPTPPAQPPVSDTDKQAARSRGQIVQIWSAALGRMVPATVFLPRDYNQGEGRYPVLYLLHGASGDHTDWNAKSGVAAYTADLPLIVVMTDAQGDSFYTDSAGFGKVQTCFLRDIVRTVDERYRTIRRREGRAIAGLSMGGYGAWRLALEAPGTFCAAASLSGALGWGSGDSALVNRAKQLFPEDTERLWAASDLWPRIARQQRRGEWRGPALYFDCGKDDFLIASNRAMEARLLTAGIPYEFAEFEGAHTWGYWDGHIRDAINFSLRHLMPPTPK